MGGETKLIFQAVRGIQANKEYFIAMVKLTMLAKLFVFNGEELSPELRSQRVLNKNRIPQMRDYILEHPNSYIFSALTVSIDGEIEFYPLDEKHWNIGELIVPADARFLINDGQHRKAAIEAALAKNRALQHEYISVVFYHDIGLKHSQQMFSDLNRYAMRPTKSLNILYDNRTGLPKIVRTIVEEVPYFNQLVELEKTSISNRSDKLFTLSAIYQGTEVLLKNHSGTESIQEQTAIDYWVTVGDNISEWRQVCGKKARASEIRKQSICTSSVALKALGMTGNQLLQLPKTNWKKKIARLQNIDWSKSNTLWNGLVIINGKVLSSKSTESNLAHFLEEIFSGE